MRSLPNPLVIRTNLYAFWSYAGLLKGVPRKKKYCMVCSAGAYQISMFPISFDLKPIVQWFN